MNQALVKYVHADRPFKPNHRLYFIKKINVGDKVYSTKHLN